MVSLRVATAVAAGSLLSLASAQEWITTKVPQLAEPTKTVAASEMTPIGCFETGIPLADHGMSKFQTDGNCQQICLGFDKPVLGLSDGENCWCGDLIPPKSAQVDNSTCNTSCSGFKDADCGGPAKLWVILTGSSRNEIENYVPEKHSSSSKSSSGKTSHADSSTGAATGGASQQPQEGDSENGGKPNTVGIAVGVVVGVLALAAIVGGVFFFLRQKRRNDVEEEYRRQAAVNSFVAGGKLHTSNSSMTDSRLDPEFMQRRASNGSIADNEDYSRRILKVTNA